LPAKENRPSLFGQEKIMSPSKLSRTRRFPHTAQNANRQADPKLTVAALAAGALALGAARVATAQIPIQYLENTNGTNFGPFTAASPTLQPSPNILNPNEIGPENFLLPGYGTVAVSLTASNFNPVTSQYTGTLYDSPSELTRSTAQVTNSGPSQTVSNSGTSYVGTGVPTGNTFTWGTNADNIGINNLNSFDEQYTLTFDFLNGAPNLSNLFLVVAGLAYSNGGAGTTASLTSANDVPSLVGEDHGPYANSPSSTTLLSQTTGGWTYSSIGDGDPVNTGWSLTQFTGAPFTSLNLNVNQVSGDGIGFSVGYVPEPASTGVLFVAAFGLLNRRLRRQRPCLPSSA
jgi:hypothetical protein